MPKVALLQVVYHTQKFMPIVFPAVFNQTYKDFQVYAVIGANDDHAKEWLQEHYPQVKIIDPGYNIGFAKGHNQLFAELDVDLFQLVNPDLVMTPKYLEEMIKVFEDPQAGAATGKILRYDFTANKPTNEIDTAGVVIARSGRGRDRGQHQIDTGQFHDQLDLIAVSGASAMYRKTALEDVKYPLIEGGFEYFDEDMHSYWEDIDLSWRMVNRGWKIKYNPKALAYHGRAAGSSKKGYKNVWAFIKHHQNFPKRILQLNYKNHILMYVKNSPKWYWKFFVREFFYHCYVVVWEFSTLKILPELIKQLPRIWQKRKYIQKTRKISVSEMEKLLL